MGPLFALPTVGVCSGCFEERMMGKQKELGRIAVVLPGSLYLVHTGTII